MLLRLFPFICFLMIYKHWILRCGIIFKLQLSQLSLHSIIFSCHFISVLQLLHLWFSAAYFMLFIASPKCLVYFYWICCPLFHSFGISSLIILDLSYCLFSAILSAFLLECCFAFIFQKYFLWNAALLDLNFLSIFVEMLLFLLFHFHIFWNLAV